MKSKSKPKVAAQSLIKCMKRRSAIEAIFGHLKSDDRLQRNLFKGKEGDHINALLAASGFNLGKHYAVFLLPILKCFKNQGIEEYFFFYNELNYKTFVLIGNK